MVNYTKKTIRGAGAIFVFGLLGSFFAYLARIVLARNLTTEEFGLFFAVFTFFCFFDLFKDLGLGEALVRFLAKFRAEENNNKAKNTVILSGSIQMASTLIMAFFILIFSVFLTKNYFKHDLAFPIIIILSIWFVTSSLQRVIFQIFYGLQYFLMNSLNSFLKNFLYFLFLMILSFFGFGIFSPAYAWLISSVILVLVFFPFLLKKFNFFSGKPVWDKKLTKQLLAFSFPVILTIVGGRIIGRIDTLLLTYFRSLSEVGVYNVILPTAFLLLLIAGSLANVIFPVSSELWAKKEKKKLGQGLKLMHKYAFLVTVPIGLALISFSELFLKFFFGKEYVAGVLGFQILILGFIFFTIAQVNNSLLSGIGKPKKVSKVILFAAGLNTVLNLLAIPVYGIEGAAIATALSYTLICILSIREVAKTIGFKAPWLDWFKTVVGGCIFVLVIFLLKRLIHLHPWLELVLVLSIASLIYLVWVFFTNVITLNEIKRLIRRTLNKS